MPIFIGIAHTVSHFMDLMTPEVNDFLQKEISILGEPQKLWNTLGVVSFMMGVSFIVIGILNISVILKTPKTHALPKMAIVAMIGYQMAVTYVGFEFEQSMQLYGGVFGLLLLSVCLVLTIKHRS
jgi:hypothetical protein